MGPGKFGGVDSLTTRCLASLGVRCSNDDDLNLAGERCPMAHGCALERLFRKNPPWLYRALRRTLANASAIRRKKLRRMIDEEALLPDDAAVSFHHVPPTRRARAMDTDPRCAIRLVSRESRAVGWWLSSCLPYLFVAGAPKAGTSPKQAPSRSTRRGRPRREELRFFTPVTDAAKHAGAAVGELLSRYANLFPSIHPRDFQVTGEASPAYVYSAAALRFFAQPNLKLARVNSCCCEAPPAHRSEHRDKSDQPRGRRARPATHPLRTTRAAAAHGANTDLTARRRSRPLRRRGVRGLGESGRAHGRGQRRGVQRQRRRLRRCCGSRGHLFLPRGIGAARPRRRRLLGRALRRRAGAARAIGRARACRRGRTSRARYNSAKPPRPRRAQLPSPPPPRPWSTSAEPPANTPAPRCCAAPLRDGALGRRDRRAHAPRPPRRRPRHWLRRAADAEARTPRRTRGRPEYRR